MLKNNKSCRFSICMTCFYFTDKKLVFRNNIKIVYEKRVYWLLAVPVNIGGTSDTSDGVRDHIHGCSEGRL